MGGSRGVVKDKRAATYMYFTCIVIMIPLYLHDKLAVSSMVIGLNTYSYLHKLDIVYILLV